MSYNLGFRFRNNKIPANVLAKYFSARRNYTIYAGEALYSNNDTGVNFQFGWQLPGENDRQGSLDDEDSEIWFELNYCRPYPFILEAEPEVSHFVSQFDLLIEDPQIGLQSVEYCKDKFLLGWSKNNEMAIRELANVPDHRRVQHALPSEVLLRCWSWNMARASLQKELTDNVFVPKISFYLQRNEVKTLISWTEGISIAIPNVDLYFLSPNFLAKPWLWLSKNRPMAVVQSKIAEPVVRQYPVVQSAGSYRLLSFKRCPKEVAQFFREHLSNKGRPDLQFLHFDQIVDGHFLNSSKPKV